MQQLLKAQDPPLLLIKTLVMLCFFHEDTYSFSNAANSYKMFHSWLYSKYIHLLIKGNSLLNSLLFRSTDSRTKKIRREKNFQGSCQKPESKESQKCSIGCTNTLKVSCLMHVDMVSSD